VPGAPLDNNLSERALKMSILHRNYPQIDIILSFMMEANRSLRFLRRRLKTRLDANSE